MSIKYKIKKKPNKQKLKDGYSQHMHFSVLGSYKVIEQFNNTPCA